MRRSLGDPLQRTSAPPGAGSEASPGGGQVTAPWRARAITAPTETRSSVSFTSTNSPRDLLGWDCRHPQVAVAPTGVQRLGTFEGSAEPTQELQRRIPGADVVTAARRRLFPVPQQHSDGASRKLCLGSCLEVAGALAQALRAHSTGDDAVLTDQDRLVEGCGLGDAHRNSVPLVTTVGLVRRVVVVVAMDFDPRRRAHVGVVTVRRSAVALTEEPALHFVSRINRVDHAAYRVVEQAQCLGGRRFRAG